MKTVRFHDNTGKYDTRRSYVAGGIDDDMSGEYVPADVARRLFDELKRLINRVYETHGGEDLESFRPDDVEAALGLAMDGKP